MWTRRDFLVGTTATLAVSIISKTARAAGPRVRRDVTGLAPSDPFFAKYADAVKKMHELPTADPRNWRNQALIHLQHCPHGLPDFPHWHRHYIANFESICAVLVGDSDFALPYWNWSNNEGKIPDPFYDLSMLNV